MTLYSLVRSLCASTNELVEELKAERAQHRFNLAEKDKELALALREVAEPRLEIARRDRTCRLVTMH